ncbi:oligosaccharide flippase family protein [Eikenella sp. S3360]|uniref:Oligosaccharide flippase family protein n=1 Tax=Eikenella glucosivorans TaxID=2766967 RepID=A0ABS0NC25_9NEIS|nr:oligosaccharide flippase family protein [Eikenella glucosivorans]MBH5329871.1 oligosaccharide flippase family protein [Eikenella glucosivorans]
MKILKDSLIYLTGEMLAKAMPFLLLPYLTRKLGTAGFGELSYYQAAFSLLLIGFGMSQDGAVTRYYYVYGQRNLHSVVYAGALYTAAAALLGLLAAWQLRSLPLAAVVCAAAAQTALATQLSLRQCRKQALSYTAIQFGSSFFTTMLTVWLLEMSADYPVERRFFALFAGNALVSLAAYGLYRRGAGRQGFNRRRVRQALGYILAFGLPLVVHHAGNYVKGQFDRVVIYQGYPAATLGVYSAGYQTASVLGVLLLALNKATVPYYYQALRSGRITAAMVRRWSLLSLAAAPLPALAVWLLPEQLFLWLLGAQYAGVHYYICLFLLGFGLMVPYYLQVNYLFYHGQNRRIAMTSLLSAGGYLLVLLLTARVGIAWVPLAMIVGNALIFPILYRQVKPYG